MKYANLEIRRKKKDVLEKNIICHMNIINKLPWETDRLKLIMSEGIHIFQSSIL